MSQMSDLQVTEYEIINDTVIMYVGENGTLELDDEIAIEHFQLLKSCSKKGCDILDQYADQYKERIIENEVEPNFYQTLREVH